MKEPILNTKEFAGSFVYLGSGADLQPLYRFSDLFTHYLYIGLGVSAEDLLRFFKLFRQGERLEFLGMGEEISGIELGLPEAFEPMVLPYPWMTRDEWREFRKAFHGFKGEATWAREFRFLRRVAGEERQLRMVYINAEAMETYHKLVEKHDAAPRMVCSVQSGRMEEPGGVLERLMARNTNKPELWLRGFEPKYWRAFFAAPRNEREEIPALHPTGLWRYKVQAYANWYSRGKDSNRELKRYAACFARSSTPWDAIPDECNLDHSEGTVCIKRKRLKPEDLDGFDLLVARQAVLDRFAGVSESVIRDCWEIAKGFGPSDWAPFSLKQALEHISKLCDRHKTRRILMLPVGLEDEGAEIQAWLESKLMKPDYLEIRTQNYLDFYTLFCPPAGPDDPCRLSYGPHPFVRTT